MTDIIRYVVTHINREGDRVMSAPARQSRYTHASEAEARQEIQGMLANSSRDTLIQVFGEQAMDTFEVRAVPCWRMKDGTLGDPKTSYFPTEADG